MLTPLIVTPIAARWGWRWAFWFTGFAGLCWLIMWRVVSREIPPKRQMITSSGVRPRIGDGRVWAFMAAYAFGALPLGFVLYSAAIYLAKARGLPQITIGELLWIHPLGWEVGYFFWGWISDRYRAARPSMFPLLMVLSLPLALAPRLPQLPLLMFELFFAMFVASGFVILSIADATEVFSADHSGLIAGLGAGSWSAVVGLVMPAFGRLFDQQRYDTAFAVAAVFPIAGYGVWRALR